MNDSVSEGQQNELTGIDETTSTYQRKQARNLDNYLSDIYH
jgi:hypothetical protein